MSCKISHEIRGFRDVVNIFMQCLWCPPSMAALPKGTAGSREQVLNAFLGSWYLAWMTSSAAYYWSKQYQSSIHSIFSELYCVKPSTLLPFLSNIELGNIGFPLLIHASSCAGRSVKQEQPR